MIDLESLGISKEELQNRVIDALCDKLLNERYFDEDGENAIASSTFGVKLTKVIKDRIDSQIAALAEEHVLPNVKTFIDNLVLQQTTEWGTKVGRPVTFIEYLTHQAETYMTEQVNYEGKSKNQSDGYSWKGTQTRLTNLVHQHLHYSIETAMKDALKIANNAIAQGIQETVKIKLAEIAAQLKVEIKTGR